MNQPPLDHGCVNFFGVGALFCWAFKVGPPPRVVLLAFVVFSPARVRTRKKTGDQEKLDARAKRFGGSASTAVAEAGSGATN